MSKVWFITGASRGFGRIWAQAALRRGDRVVATARSRERLKDLIAEHGDRVLTLALDVTDKGAAQRTVHRAHEHFGRLDVVVNNAGYGLFGMVEEVTEAQARAQMETNFFGALWVTQAALPLLRAQGSGHIIQVSSIAGIFAFPSLGFYNASKWALEGLSQALQGEVQGFGIHVTLIEPKAYATDWGGSSAIHAQPNPAYDRLRQQLDEQRRLTMHFEDPEATGPVILDIVDMQEPPLRVLFGKGPLDLVRTEYASRLETWTTFADLSEAAQTVPART